LAIQGNDSDTLGLTYAMRILSAATARPLAKTNPIAAIDQSVKSSRFIIFVRAGRFNDRSVVSRVPTPLLSVRNLLKINTDCKTEKLPPMDRNFSSLALTPLSCPSKNRGRIQFAFLL
jgi:hypothetical protein